MNKPDNRFLWRYAGLATQFIAGIGFFVFAGIKIDERFFANKPNAAWVLPLLFIFAAILKIIRDTSRKK